MNKKELIDKVNEHWGTVLVLALWALLLFGPSIYDSVKNIDSKDEITPVNTSSINVNKASSLQERIKNNPPVIAACDNPNTTDNECNNQPLGSAGTETVYACNEDSGNCYDLDADISDGQIESLYFQKGGNVDIDYGGDCYDGGCYAEDESGTEWYIERDEYEADYEFDTYDDYADF